MNNQNLTTNINVRTTLNVKKKLMDESERREMNMTEYVLFILECYWNKVETPQQENDEIQQLHEELTEVRKNLQETQGKVIELMNDNAILNQQLRDIPKSIWKEASQTTAKLSEEHIQKQVNIALSGYQQQMREQLVVNENQKIQLLNERIKQYETPLLKTIFKVIAASNNSMKDLPDIVSVLTHHYYQQVVVPNQIQSFPYAQ